MPGTNTDGRKAGKLCLVATPIGNLEDITLRALQRLREADLIAAEDTRRTRKLLTRYEISRPLTSYYRDREQSKAVELVRLMLQGRTIALVTDAGTPGISDPGLRVVTEARRQGVAVEVIPGPSALLAALMGAGLPTEAFTFHGFLENRPTARKRRLEALKNREETQVFFIAPHRLAETLEDILEIWGDRPAVLCRELTKIHEEFSEGRLSELGAAAREKPARGEHTLVITGGDKLGPEFPESLQDHLRILQAEGLTLNQAVARAARERGLPRAGVYVLAHKGRGQSQ
ncbi:16S rRNA (cytidine(1402)-2'-O)-methyltransferase [bacterium]|nr:16S rRNA (cytidine(1402)-2'-O)-methyltransferase [bacterium]